MRHRVLVLLFATSLQCGLDEEGVLGPTDASSPDVVSSDGGSDVVQAQDAPPDVPAPPVEAGICDEDADYCQPSVVPAGWSPVAYAENPATSCPTTDWPAQDDYVSSVQNGTAACTCGCTKTGDPNCTTGKISTFYSGQFGCGTQGASLAFTDGGCISVGGAIDNYYASSAVPSTGTGACTSQAAQNGNLATTPARTCAPEPKCKSAACAGTAPAGWLACIVADGDQSCPTGSPFSQKHAIAKSASFSCAQTCGCNVTGTCDTPQVHFFSGGNCTQPLVTLASDGGCVATNNGNTFVATASYSATPNFKCNPSGTSAVQVQPATPKTVCCR